MTGRFTELTADRPASWRQFAMPILNLTLIAYLFDLALALRISYMGSTDEKARQIIFEVFWPDILAIQFKIVTVMVAISALLWLWARFGLRLSNRGASFGAFLFWVALTIRHARVWPAPYADIRDIRPITDDVFIGMIEGRLGIATISACLGGIALIVAFTIYRERFRLQDGTLRPYAPVQRLIALAPAALMLWVVGTTPELPDWTRKAVANPKTPDVLFLMADSWRADYFECTPQSRLTPRLGKLCQDYGRKHYKAYPSQNRTFGSITSFFTGLPNDKTGITHMMVRTEHRNIRHLSLVNDFNRLGYSTMAISGLSGDVFPRVDLAFQQVDAPRFGFASIIAEFNLRWHPLMLPWLSTNRWGREWIEPRFRNFGDIGDPVFEAGKAIRMASDAGNEPLMLTAFLSGTHFPYAGREGAAWRRGNDPAIARYRWYPTPYESGHVDPALIPAIRNRYADKVQHIDEVIGQVAEQALANGNTIVVVASDHGEHLYELGEGSHGDHLFNDGDLGSPLLILDGRKNRAALSVSDVTEPTPTGETDATLYSLHDVVPAVLRAVTEGTEIVLPRHRALYVQSGIIIKQFNDRLLDGYRIPYPEIMDLLELDFSIGDMVVQKKWERTVELGKFRGLLTPQWAFIYSPGCKAPRISMYPREATDKATPAYSVDRDHPQEIDAAWNLMQQHWGADLVRRDTCGLQQ